MKVTIPSRANHNGLSAMTIEIPDTCPKCGGLRGEVFDTISYDGSRRLAVSGWLNPCGHIDGYSAVREEYITSQRE